MAKRVEIQDNKRENELRELFRLKKTNENRIGIDAHAEILGQDIFFELKSTTVDSVSTARHFTLRHIEKWRSQHWIVGIYNKDATLSHCYYGTPCDMKPWLDFWENDIKRGIHISDMLVDRIDKQMMYEVFGKKPYYTLEEAKKVYKQLYKIDEYLEMMDHPKGFRVRKMLELFKEHNRAYLYRGAALNNPKINKNYYEQWVRIEVDTDYPTTLRRHVRAFLKGNKAKRKILLM